MDPSLKITTYIYIDGNFENCSIHNLYIAPSISFIKNCREEITTKEELEKYNIGFYIG